MYRMPALRATASHAIGAVCLALATQLPQAQEEPIADILDENSPWLLTPTISSDPKLGTNIGAVGGYIFRADPESRESVVMAFGTYSDTDSWVIGAFGDLYLSGNQHRVSLGVIDGTIRNEYDDFLGTGVKAETEDDIKAIFGRYLYNIGGAWYLGGQAISSNYAIGADGLLGKVLEQIGLVGFDSNGIGAVLEYDTRDNVRNPTRGQRWVAHNIAYRESLGGDESFDAYNSDYTHYLPFGDGHLLGVQVFGRWTHDAPLGGFSSVRLRGYTRGNYLAEHYTHVDLDARFALGRRWGATAFAGLGCLYETVSDCGSSDDLYPAAGAGLYYLLKPEAGFVIRADYAVGDRDNSAFYLRLGHPF